VRRGIAIDTTGMEIKCITNNTRKEKNNTNPAVKPASDPKNYSISFEFNYSLMIIRFP